MLKNAIDYLYPEWNRKPASFVAYGNAGGARGRYAPDGCERGAPPNGRHSEWRPGSIDEAQRESTNRGVLVTDLRFEAANGVDELPHRGRTVDANVEIHVKDVGADVHRPW